MDIRARALGVRIFAAETVTVRVVGAVEHLERAQRPLLDSAERRGVDDIEESIFATAHETRRAGEEQRAAGGKIGISIVERDGILRHHRAYERQRVSRSLMKLDEAVSIVVSRVGT